MIMNRVLGWFRTLTRESYYNCGKNTRIGEGTVIKSGVEIGDNCVIESGSIIGSEVCIGNNCIIGSNVVLKNCRLGSYCIIHSGACIGQDGFGFELSNSGEHKKKPQELQVWIEDHVEIGANSTIDRGSWRNTVLGKGTKLDNLVQIGHNVVIGEGCIIAAQCGIGGSTTLGRCVYIGGQSGIHQHITLGTF